MKALILSIVLVAILPVWGWPATWYVRPDTDGNGTDLNYGAEDGTSYATAFDGFADIAGIVAGDTVCLPGSDEPFFEQLNTGTAGTHAARVTYAGCGSDHALIWSAQGLSGTRSFNSSRAAVTGAAYAWSADLGQGVYKKRIDVRPKQLWEDRTWLQPVNINAASEATVLGTLAAGQWGVRDAGDGTYLIYYRATASGKTPATTVIRCEDVPYSDGSRTAIVVVDVDYQTFQDIDVWGLVSDSSSRSFYIVNASHIILDDMVFYRNMEGPSIIPASVAITDITWRNLNVQASCATSVFISPITGVTGLLVEDSEFSGALASCYNGTDFTPADGDGFAIGQGGGTVSNVVLKRIVTDRNANAGIFIGTTFSMTVMNFEVYGWTADGNVRNCWSEGASNAQTAGRLIFSGFLCTGTTEPNTYATFFFGATPPAARTVVMANGTIAGNYNFARVKFYPHADSNYIFRNLLFTNNPGNASSDYGDFYSSAAALIGDEIFDNISFYSLPNLNRRIGRLGVAQTAYAYNSGSDFTSFTTAVSGTNLTINTDPLVTSDYKLQPTSPLKRTGTQHPYCRDARGRPCWSPPDIGAYQSTSGDPAATRAVRN